MTNTRDVILKLKEVKKEKGLSLDKILLMMENDGNFLSKSTLSRVFAKGSEDKSFRYEETIRPIANALLDIENIESDDDIDTQAYKAILKLKKDLIIDLENKLQRVESDEKLKYQKKLEEQAEKFQRSIDFLNHQIELKDKRIDHLLNVNERLANTNDKLSDKLITCPTCTQK